MQAALEQRAKWHEQRQLAMAMHMWCRFHAAAVLQRQHGENAELRWTLADELEALRKEREVLQSAPSA